MRLMILASFLMACSNTPTQVIIEIDADEDIRETVEEIRLQVYTLDADGESAERVFLGSRGVSGWPMRHVVTPRDGDSSRRYLVVATGLDSSATYVSEGRIKSGYLADQVGLVRLVLPGGACVGVSCPDDTTCRVQTESGLCVEIPNVTPVPEGGDASMPDAGMDAGDAGPDVPVPVCEAGLPCELPEPGDCVEGMTECLDGAQVCVAHALAAGTVCLAADPTNECDLDDVCDGESFACPVVAAPDETPCGDEGEGLFCFDAACRPCIQDEMCRPDDNVCQVGRRDCTGESPVCVFERNANDGTTCRVPVMDGSSPCDAAERCMGGVCPADGARPEGALCREPMGLCDAPEVCNGIDKACPTDQLRTSVEVCREARDENLCEGDAFCDGASPICPMWPILSRVICNDADGPCDITEFCDEVNRTCPADERKPAGAACGAEGNVCNATGACVSPTCDGPCPDPNNPCRIGRLDCATNTCSGPFTDASNGTICGTDGDGAGVCQDAPQCSNGICSPPVIHANVVCRATSGVCDLEERCTTTGSCPEDASVADGSDCGTSNACRRSSCDSGSCASTFQQAGTVCGSTECTIAYCDGSGTCEEETRPDDTACGVNVRADCSGPDSCQGGECNNNDVDPEDSCLLTDPGQCQTAMCTTDGTCSVDPVPNNTVCAGGLCDAGRCSPEIMIGEIAPPASLSAPLSSYLELYNRTASAITLNGCTLELLSGTTGNITPINLGPGAIVPGRGFFLIARPGFSPAADRPVNMFTVDALEGGARLKCGDQEIDAVAWGGSGAGEGDPLGVLSLGETFERKACEDADQSSMSGSGTHANLGNGWDENSNVNDFVLRTDRVIQNSSMSETPMCGMVTM